MAQFIFNVDDGKQQRLINAFAKAHGYEAKIISQAGLVDNPENKGQFFRRLIKEFILRSWKDGEIAEVVETARATAEQTNDQEIS